jgi:hypothetical protein
VSQAERIVTTMEALVAKGALAGAISSSVESIVVELESNSELTSARHDLVEDFVVGRIATATSEILGSGGDISTISTQLEVAFARGITLGLAVGTESCPDRINSGIVDP